MKFRLFAGSAILLSAALILSACSSNSSAVTNLGAQEFLSKTQSAGVVVLDVRTAQEFQQGHIQGAMNIDVEGTSFESEIAKLDKGTTYALYCQSGRRSGVASQIMSKSGFTSLFNLQNGIQSWTSAGLPMVRT